MGSNFILTEFTYLRGFTLVPIRAFSNSVRSTAVWTARLGCSARPTRSPADSAAAARRSSSPAPRCRKPKAERVYAVERIGRRQIEQSPSHELDQLLKDVPGCSCFAAPMREAATRPARASPFARSAATLRAGALLVLDGVPQSDPFGGWVNWPAYDPAEPGRRSASCAAAGASGMGRARSPGRSR